MVITILFIAITVLVSLAAFNNNELKYKLMMYPRVMDGPKDYYRLLTSGFIHADMMHLGFNMLTLYFFGQNVEYIMALIFGQGVTGSTMYAILYITGIIMASLPGFIKHRNNSSYAALGASGGVSAVLFFTIFYAPWSGIRFLFIPFDIPAIIFGVLYSLYSYYMAKRATDNIGHDAHLSGGIYGFLFALLVDPTHGLNFLYKIMHPVFNQ